VIDFQALKQAVSIDEVAINYLKLDITENKDDNIRAVCPHCESTDPRAIIITPSKGLFYCFKARKGGDCISLVSHCHGTSPRESAEALAKVYMDEEWQGTKEDPQPKPEAKTTKGFDPLKYIESLKRKQDDVSEFGLTAEFCKETGAGLCTKGINRGKLAIPVRLEDGTLIGFVGVSGDVSAPKKFRIT
jgi:DNA primase